MKRMVMASVVVMGLLSAGIACADGKSDECVLPPPYAGSAEFQRMKSLAGAWEGANPMMPEGKMKVVYEVTSNGSAVVERTAPGTPHEMVTVYHDEKGRLAMTHYCALGNQPKLTLASATPDTIQLTFAKDNVIRPKKEDHMHALAITFLGPDQIQQEWVGYRHGQQEKPMTFTLTRVKE